MSGSKKLLVVWPGHPLSALLLSPPALPTSGLSWFVEDATCIFAQAVPSVGNALLSLKSQDMRGKQGIPSVGNALLSSHVL